MRGARLRLRLISLACSAAALLACHYSGPPPATASSSRTAGSAVEEAPAPQTTAGGLIVLANAGQLMQAINADAGSARLLVVFAPN